MLKDLQDAQFLGDPGGMRASAQFTVAVKITLSPFAHVAAKQPSSSLRDIMTSAGEGVILHTLGTPAST